MSSRPRDPLRVATLCVSILFAASCDRGESPVAPSQVPGLAATSAQGRIAFTSNRDGAYGIYVMNDDGTAVTRLTNDSDYQPAWSPDGTRLAFTSTRDGNNELYVMNADGTGGTRLTNDTALDLTPAWSPDGSRIAFASARDGNDEVYVMNADGSGVTRLTNNPTWDGEPVWSPDGSRLAFASSRGGTLVIEVMNADGTGVAQISGTGWSADPAWSPDGSRIAFKGFVDGNHEIYVMNADGTGVTRLTNSPGTDEKPVWSGDGTRIAFGSDRDGDFEIYVMNADGTGVRQLTSDSTNDVQPAWFGASDPPPNQPPVARFTPSCSGLTCGFTSTSSDADGSIVAYSWTFGDGGMSTARNPSHTYASAGTYAVTLTVTDNQGATGSASDSVTVSRPTFAGKIAFTSYRDGNNEIYVMNANGSGVTRLTDNPAVDQDPAWSPDGTRLAFTSTRDGNAELYVMNADGSGVTRLTTDPGKDGHPAWCGTKIAFDSDRHGTGFPDIYVMNEDGTGVTGLTLGGAAFDEYASWSPSCDQIAYSYDAFGMAAAIHVMNADGSGNQTVGSPDQDSYPAWSPDGTRIAFTSRRDADQPPVPLEIREIYVMNVDGSGATRLTHTTVNAVNLKASWSPDGTHIAFQSNRDGNNDIFVMNADGTNLTRLTGDAAADAQPAWLRVSTPPPPIHVADLDGSSATAGSSWSATVAVTVQDTTQALVSGATVTGTWSVAGESSCTTDRSGACTVVIGLQNRVHGVTFTVTGVTLAGGVYNPAANQDADGDSTGTAITVNR